MNFTEILEKSVGRRYSCSGVCAGPASGPGGSDELGLEIVFIVRLIVSCAAFAVSLLVSSIPAPWPVVLLILAVLIAGWDIAAGAVLSILKGRYLDKTVLVTLSVVLALIFGFSVEGTALVLLYQIGCIFVEYAYIRTYRSVLDEIHCEPDDARVFSDGEESIVPANSVEVGDTIIILPGERVPCDCIVLEGTSSLDKSPLGDYSGAVMVKEGDEILSGCINREGQLRCEVTSTSTDSAAAALYSAVENGAKRGDVVPGTFAWIQTYLTPIITVAAILVLVLLPLIFDIPIDEAVRRAAMLLVLASPCALNVAMPLIRLCAMCGAAKSGVLYDGCSAMDSAASLGTVAFDKAGTLSEGSPKVTAIKSERMEPEVLLKIAAHALAYSNTPQARSVIACYGDTIYIDLIENFVEIPGSGVEVKVDGIRICVGSRDLMMIKGVSVPEADVTDDYSYYISIGDEYAGRIVMADALRADAAEGVAELRACGMDGIIMFTDESRDAAARAASALSISEYYSECDREKMRGTLADIKQGCVRGRLLAFVGSGEVFGGSHSAADVDIAMTGVEALTMPVGTDITIFGGSVDKVSQAIAVSRYARMLSTAVVGGAALVKLVLIVIAALGFSTLWFSVFLDAIATVGASLVSILAFGGEIRQPKGKHEAK